jgi:hypothetical protein
MRYAGNNTNLARTAALTATNALASDAIYRTDTAAKAGGGQVVVSGPYTGAADTDIDIEIASLAGSTPQVSDPAFSGVGNGTLTDLAVAGLAAQTITITLEDLGTETRKAYAPFQGVTLRAKAAGAGGNAITISIDQSGLSLAATDFATQEDVQAGTNEYEGTHWDISALGEMTLTPDGKIPTTAPRVVFGGDPQVYLAFRKYRDGRYVYGFSPSPVRDVARGTRVFKVTGTRTLAIRDGVGAPEVFTGCGSLYQTLAAIRDGSALVGIDGLVVNDRLPGGQAAVDLSVWTASYVQSVSPDGSYSCLKANLVVTPAATAPTEQLKLQCIDASVTGREVWRAEGDVTGRLPNATTGQAFASGPYAFTIPLPEIDEGGSTNTTGQIGFSYQPIARGDDERLPKVRAFLPRIGAAARNGVYEFTWTKRPPEDCAEDGQVVGGPNPDCLGVNPPGDETVTDASRKIRLQRLTAAVRQYVDANTAPGGEVTVTDVAAIKKGAAILRDILVRMQAGTLAYPAWEASTAYPIDDVVEPTAANGYRYAVTTAGTSSGTEPATWTTTIGGTVTDGGVTWTNVGKSPYGMWDDMLATWMNEAAMLSGLGPSVTAATWSTMATAAAIDGSIVVGSYAKPSTSNGCIYRALTAATGQGWATFGDAEPVWPTYANGSPSDRTVTADTPDGSGIYRTNWILAYCYWQARATVALGTIARPGNGHSYKVTTAGATGTSEPTWPTTAGGTVSDGTATWTEVATTDLIAAPDDLYFERYTAAGNDVLAAAGLDANFDGASTNGDGCWQDPGDGGFWESTDGYLPAFNNLYWHSSRQYLDEDGNPYNQSTYEFGLGFQVGCEELLKYGDKCYVEISGVVGGSTGQGYQAGDTFNVGVQNAVPVPFGGGQAGDDTLTWSVVLGSGGRIDDYTLITTALAPYAWTDGSATLDFAITPGGIPFALGDRFVAEIEGGQFKWRRDGGSWSSNIDIGTTALADGLSAVFAGGVAPSWKVGDRWTYRAESTYGAVQLRTPLDGECEWSGSTVIEIAGGAINGVGLYRHRIPEGATITLTGSDDGFSTTPLSVTIPWRRDNIWQGAVANHAAYRISVNTSGALRWLYVGTGTKLQLSNGAYEVGRMVKRLRLASAIAPSGLGATVTHEALPSTATDALLALLEHAVELNDSLLGIIPNDAQPETGLARYESDTVEVADLRDFQPTDIGKLWQSVSLALAAA